MDSDGDGDGASSHSHQAKKRRVTRACDNCRRRRIKCQAYPNASLDAPCVICTDAGTSQQCTYSKPPRKRGPQAGKARSLAEKCATFERLLGYLATAIPNLEAYVTAFATQSATSPASGSNAPPPMASDTFQQTYESSRMPEILDAILPPVVSAREAAKLKLDDKVETSPLPFGLPPLGPASGAGFLPHLGYQESISQSVGPDPSRTADHLRGYNLPVPPPAPASITAGLDTVMSPFDPASSSNSRMYPLRSTSAAALPYPLAGSASAGASADTATSLPSAIPFALHTLADAAVPDSSSPIRAHLFNGEQSARRSLVDDGDSKESALQIPDGPARSALLDLYFNQVVQPSLPMLDKSAFLRWSAYLPSSSAASATATSLPQIPPYLYLAVFALSSIYVPPSSPLRTALPPDAPRVYASAARSALLQAVMRDRATSGDDRPIGIEATQSAVLLALCDWAQGELDRAWTMTSLAITLTIGQSLHLPLPASNDASDPARPPAPIPPSPARLRTLHAVLIVHSLLSLRLERVPLSAALLDDFADSIPPPPTDEAENWDLWRSDKTAAELRTEWTGEAESPPSANGAKSVCGGIDGDGSRALTASGTAVAAALPSNSLLVFARLAELCNIGTAVLRSTLRGRMTKVDDATSLSATNLLQRLQKWEAALEAEVRLEATTGQELAALVTERPRWTVAMHLLAETLRLSLLKESDVAESVARIAHLVELQRAVFTPFRSLPMSELVLHRAASALTHIDFATASGTVANRQAVRGLAKTANDLSRALPVAQLSYDRLLSLPCVRSPGLVWTESTRSDENVTSIQSQREPQVAAREEAEPANANLEPFQAFLSYAQDLGPSAEPSTILDFGSWDQSDLLVSLGLVGAPNAAASSGPTTHHDPWSVWNAPIEGMMNVGEADHDHFPLPVLAETGLDAAFPQAAGGGGTETQVSTGAFSYGAPSHPGSYRMPSEQDSVSSRSVAPSDAAMISPASQVYPLPHRPEASARQVFPTSATAPTKVPPVPAQQMQPLPPQAAPTQQQSFSFPPALTDSAYLPRSLFGTPGPSESSMVLDGQQAYEAALGTDLLTRWLDRGTLGFSTPDVTASNSRSGTENVSEVSRP